MTMTNSPVVCENSCLCQRGHDSTDLIVLTGGPGAGKTAALEFVRKIFCEHAAILPEAASILFGGGFWRMESVSAKKAAQIAIYHVQKEMENLVLGEKKWTIGLCDRGTLDGHAYWPGQRDDFFNHLETALDAEYKRYNAVIHLQSPSLDTGYNHQNPIRIETAHQASEIDKKIHEIWKNHPNYFLIESKADFSEKVNLAVRAIQSFVPECCKGHLK